MKESAEKLTAEFAEVAEREKINKKDQSPRYRRFAFSVVQKIDNHYGAVGTNLFVLDCTVETVPTFLPAVRQVCG